MLEGEGIDLITVHARLSDEPFSRRPRWHWLSKIKKWVRLPIVANGSIDSVSSARVCLEQSGADGLMMSRMQSRLGSLQRSQKKFTEKSWSFQRFHFQKPISILLMPWQLTFQQNVDLVD